MAGKKSTSGRWSRDNSSTNTSSTPCGTREAAGLGQSVFARQMSSGRGYVRALQSRSNVSYEMSLLIRVPDICNIITRRTTCSWNPWGQIELEQYNSIAGHQDTFDTCLYG